MEPLQLRVIKEYGYREIDYSAPTRSIPRPTYNWLHRLGMLVMVAKPDLIANYPDLETVASAIKFRPSGPGWYYRNNGQSCLLLLKLGLGYQILVWNDHDPRPSLRNLIELQAHHLN